MLLILDTKEDVALAKDLYKKYSKLMFKVANEILNNTYSSEDAVHQAFVKVMNNIAKINMEDEKHTRNYICLIAKNTAIDIYNEQKNQPAPIDDNFTQYDLDISHTIIDKETVSCLMDNMRNLKDIYKIPLIMKAYGYSINNISNALNIKPKTAQKRIERARAILYKSLEMEDI